MSGFEIVLVICILLLCYAVWCNASAISKLKKGGKNGKQS